MRTAPSCSEQWARRSHASPRSIFPPLKCCVLRKKWQTESECTQTQSSPSLDEAHYSHGVSTFKNTPAVAGCMEFLSQPPKKTQQLCGVKVAAPRCCPHFTWQDKFHARVFPDTSLIECTPTEHVKNTCAQDEIEIREIFSLFCLMALASNPTQSNQNDTPERMASVDKQIIAPMQKTAKIWVLHTNSRATVASEYVCAQDLSWDGAPQSRRALEQKTITK
ncbi:hypothetical protein TcCL_ESM04231 [Trypanosoma cruzi]|nr:hypothetical protein TcCL_ESM04231 [Trypanosoma cruzi]